MNFAPGERYDAWLLGGLVLAFALLVTTHLTIVVGLASRAPRWRALIAVVALPLAPYWAARNRWWVRAVLWVTSAVAYVVTRGLAGR